MTLPRALGATYRLQLGPELGFFRAAERVAYLASLGIETLYCSPIAEAVPGSEHGYDGTDPTHLRQELGGDVGFAALVAACEEHGLGLLVDLVPNHLSTWPGGPWWRRLLREGRESELAEVYDIDWDAGSAESRGKVLLPLLDRPLAEALAASLVRLAARDGESVVEVASLDLPVSGGTVREGEDLTEVLAAQHYRLVDWHDASQRNYRRFFDIDSLVGVRVESADVFERTHALVIQLARSGRLSGIRVDHVDGLRLPAAYLRRLAERTGVPIVVEKILTGDETLPADWPVLGTTGYEVLDDVAGALVDPEGLDQLVAQARAEGEAEVEPLTVDCRRLVAGMSFGAETRRAAGRLGVPEGYLRETLIRLPRYRTYAEAASGKDRSGGARSGGDGFGGDGFGEARSGEARSGEARSGEARSERARSGKAGRAASLGTEDVATWRAAGDPEGGEAVVDALLDPANSEVLADLQQLTGAIMAKGVEDTAWYRLAGPLALCEVGGDPGRARHDGIARLLARATTRVESGRAGLVPGTTHDTKRSDDLRCRLYVLSELPERFGSGLARFREALGLRAGGGPLAFETRVLAQLLLGVLPPLGEEARTPPDGLGDAWSPGDSHKALADRVHSVIIKSAREAKLRSSWRQPDEGYEQTWCSLADAALADGAALLRASFTSLVDDVARLGAVNSLSCVVLRAVLPGIPDCFEGDETWDLSMVDPDNRRSADFDHLAEALAGLAGAGAGSKDVATLRHSWRDGRVKLLVTHRSLFARRSTPAPFFPAAPLVGLAAEGAVADSVLAVARRGIEQGWALGVVTRLASVLSADEDDLPAGPSYAGSRLPLPDEAPGRWLEAISGRKVAAEHGELLLEEVFEDLPVALLLGLEDDG